MKIDVYSKKCLRINNYVLLLSEKSYLHYYAVLLSSHWWHKIVSKGEDRILALLFLG